MALSDGRTPGYPVSQYGSLVSTIEGNTRPKFYYSTTRH